MPSGAARRLTAAALPVAAVAFAWASLASPLRAGRRSSRVGRGRAPRVAADPAPLEGRGRRPRPPRPDGRGCGRHARARYATWSGAGHRTSTRWHHLSTPSHIPSSTSSSSLAAAAIRARHRGHGRQPAVRRRRRSPRPVSAGRRRSCPPGTRSRWARSRCSPRSGRWPSAASATGAASFPALRVLAGVVVAATLVAGAGARPSVAALDWKSWDLFGESRAGRTVALVWSSNYGGIDFPATKTTVLRVTAPRRALYWRATTLDSFAGDRWIESLYATGTSDADGPLPRDPLLPAAAASRAGWVKQEVEVQALVDDHVDRGRRSRWRSPATPTTGSGIAQRRRHAGRRRARRQMRRYTVWSYAPAPTPAGLVRSPAGVPGFAVRGTSTSGGRSCRRSAPPGERPRSRRSSTTTATSSCGPTRASGARPGVSPRSRRRRTRRRSGSSGGCARTAGSPTTSAHRSRPARRRSRTSWSGRSSATASSSPGTMALMLRYLGIPARVAVGFTSGTWKDGRWTVTDHDAHAWVEAWFAGHGWLAFDPTPGRGTLTATYTNASDSADAIAALGTGRFLGLGGRGSATSRRGVAPEARADGPRRPLVADRAVRGAWQPPCSPRAREGRPAAPALRDPRSPRPGLGGARRAGRVPARSGSARRRDGVRRRARGWSSGASASAAMHLRRRSHAPATDRLPARRRPRTTPARSCGG